MLLSKAIDYGWTAWDSYQSLRVINDPKASQAAKTEAKANLALAAVSEAVEPDDLLPIGLPLDDLARKGMLRLGKGAAEGIGKHADGAVLQAYNGQGGRTPSRATPGVRKAHPQRDREGHAEPPRTSR